MNNNFDGTVAVVGLGYVGLPLAVHLSKYFNTIGFEINTNKVDQIKKNNDPTNEVGSEALKNCSCIFTSDPSQLKKADVIIVAVPTPVDKYNNPDLTPVIAASRTIGKNMKKGCTVVYESTVYPGVTEDICIPEIEKNSQMSYPKDFAVGYSPERINPGDKINTLSSVKKIVSASDNDTLEKLSCIYGKVVTAGIYKAPSIKVAEAAKVIENTQRDINIAFVNELSIIFNKLGINTRDVLKAAGSKWNFLHFYPGLVGGHCIGVDPYYLVHKAKEIGVTPRIISAGRAINDGMGVYVATNCVKQIIKNDQKIVDSRIGILGLTFKENVPDIRNTKVIDIINELKDYKANIIVHDPCADPADVEREYGLKLTDLRDFKDLDALILAVSHDRYYKLTNNDIRGMFNKDVIVIDVKGFFQEKKEEDWCYWSL